MEPGPRVLAPFLSFGGGSGAIPARGPSILTGRLKSRSLVDDQMMRVALLTAAATPSWIGGRDVRLGLFRVLRSGLAASVPLLFGSPPGCGRHTRSRPIQSAATL